MKKLALLTLLLLLISNLFAWTSSNAGRIYTMDDLCTLSDSISLNDTTGYYDVRCDIVILENDTLKLNPGETIKFYSVHDIYKIEIYGCLKALGKQLNKITLGDPECNLWNGEYWAGIKFYNTSPNGESILEYCNIIGASGRNYINIYCENSSPKFEHCTINYMWPPIETGGGTAIYCAEQSYPTIKFCTFEYLNNSVAIACGVSMLDGLFYQDTINYPSPYIYECNISHVSGFWEPSLGCDYDRVVLNGGFLNNCYLGIDTSLGEPIDTIGNGICNTTSIVSYKPRFWNIDGVKNPRSEPVNTEIDEHLDINLYSKYFSLQENYPNPFHTQTTINYTINKNIITVSLLIYNSKGQIINTLIKNKSYQKGEYSIIWNGDNSYGEKVPTGIYFIKLKSENHEQTKRAIYIKQN